MKTFCSAMLLCILIFTACSKTIDVPSLDEKKQGKWKIRSYTTEKYQPSINMVTRQEVLAGPNDYMDFEGDNLLVHFDTAAAQWWSCKIINDQTLSIGGEPWAIVKLTPTAFKLSLNVRDTSIKISDMVLIDLVRPVH